MRGATLAALALAAAISTAVSCTRIVDLDRADAQASDGHLLPDAGSLDDGGGGDGDLGDGGDGDLGDGGDIGDGGAIPDGASSDAVVPDA